MLNTFKLFLVWPSRREFIFACRNVIAASIALYVALKMGLPRPFWAPMATCIVSHAMAGNSFVRAGSRVIGTMMGLAAAVFIMVSFINYTILLCFSVGLWVGFCLYMSMMRRAADNYIFTVAGFTVPVIIFGIIGDNNGVNISFITDQAVSRAQETCIGFFAAIIAHSIFLPDNIGPTVVRRMDQIWMDIRQLIDNALMGQENIENMRQLNAVRGLTDLRVLCASLPYERSTETWANDRIRLLQDRLTLMIPLISTIKADIQSLKKANKFTPFWQTLTEKISLWIHYDSPEPANTQFIKDQIRQGTPKVTPQSSWDEVLTVNLANDLNKLISYCEDRINERRNIDDCLSGRASFKPDIQPVPISILHKDYGHAFLISLSAVVSITAVSFLWAVSGWSAGFCAPMMASIFYLSFLRGDNAVFALKTILVFTIISLIPAFFYLLTALYSAHSYEMLMMLLAPSILFAGLYQSRPGTGLGATIYMMGIWSTTTMWDLDMANIACFVNGQAFAQCAGITMTLLCAHIFRSLDSSWVTKRLINSVKDDILDITRFKKAPSLSITTVKMIDRISMIAPRLPGNPDEKENVIASLFRDMRVGLHFIDLMNMKERLLRNGVTIDHLIEKSRQFYKQKQPSETEKKELLLTIDSVLEKICEKTNSARQSRAVATLTSIRRDIFPEATPYYPSRLAYMGSL